MARLIVTKSDTEAAAHIGGIVDTRSFTFDIEHAELERALTTDAYESVTLSCEVRKS